MASYRFSAPGDGSHDTEQHAFRTREFTPAEIPSPEPAQSDYALVA